MFPRRPSHKVQVLETSPLFCGLGRRHLDLIARHADQVTLDTGAAWARHGRIPREVLFVVEGVTQVERDGEVIGCLGAGDFFGDLELVDGERRIERVIAETPEELSAFFAFQKGPPAPFVPEHLHDVTMCAIVACYAGPDLNKGEEVVKPAV